MSGRSYGGRNGGRGGGRSGRGRSGRGGAGRYDNRGRGGGRGGRGRGGAGRGGAGRGRGPDLSNIKNVLTNTLMASIDKNFEFYQYPIDFKDKNGNQIESMGQRKVLFDKGIWDKLLPDISHREKEDLMRCIYFAGSFAFAARPIPGMEPANLQEPRQLVDGTDSEGCTMTVVGVMRFAAPSELVSDDMAALQAEMADLEFDLRCGDCLQAFTDRDSLISHCTDTGHSPVFRIQEGDPPVAAPIETFTSYVNMALQRALSERLQKWGKEFVDRGNPNSAVDRRGNELGVDIYEAFSCHFGVLQRGGNRDAGAPQGRLALTCDLRAKVIRKTSLLEVITEGKGLGRPNFSPQEQASLKREWIGEIVIYKHDKKCYTVRDLLFDKTPNSLPVSDRGMSHTEYFEQKKGIKLEHPNSPPMVAVIGRQDSTIYLPAELIAGNELDPCVKEQLPLVASFNPEQRNRALEKLKAFLIPGAQKTKGAGGLLPAIGITLDSERLKCRADVMGIPEMIAAGIKIPRASAENWAPKLSKANFNIEGNQVTTLNVVLVRPQFLSRGALGVYNRIRDCVNNFRAQYRFSAKPCAIVDAGSNNRSHYGSVEKYFSGKIPSNVFVLDFVKPRGALDPGYPVVKQMLATSGHLSSFVNFKTYNHADPHEERKSGMILQGVSRQILQKAGVRLWWVSLPPEVPLPAVFVGVDVFHAAMVYDQDSGRRKRKASCAAIIVEVIRGNQSRESIELYCKTFRRQGGNEFELGDAMKETISEALKFHKVNPGCCVVWRDGISETSFDHAATAEIAGVRQGLTGSSVVGKVSKKGEAKVPLTYIVCQKRIPNKFLTENGQFGAPSGTLVTGLQGFKHQTFYINGRAPPFSTPKPTRYIVVERDEEMNQVPLARLTWGQCHSYPNWAGPIKVPSTCQMAHKLAELAGSFNDCGESIDAKAYKNKVYFL